MKTNKGFTLIELLAVIVILAIIALIATPTILGVIETARQGAAKSSALGYIDAIEKQIAIDMVTGATTVDYSSGTVTAPVSGITLKGEKPTSGQIKINTSSGVVTSGTCLVIPMNGKSYNVHYDGTTAEVKSDACPTA